MSAMAGPKDTGDGESAGRPRRVLRKFLLRLAAVLVVLLPLVLIEAGLRAFVPAPPVESRDPYVSFTAVKPLFVLDTTGKRFATSSQRLEFFRPQSFSAEKGPDTFRVFCLGGSTVQGRPYSVETAFTTWLALSLEAARAETNWEVVNCGGISYASYRLVPILKEVLGHEPDLLILYTGHNEFLEDRTYRRLKRAPAVLVRLHRSLLGLRSYALADRWFSRRHGGTRAKTVLPAEVEATLDLQEGLASYHRDDVWRQGTIEHFRLNLETMLGLACEAAVPVVVMNPASNLKDCPPFKSELGADLTDDQRRRVLDLIERADALGWDDTYGKITLLQGAATTDSRHAGLLYRIGACYQRLGRFAEARQWFLRAKEEDVCPLRILEPMHEVILDAARRHDAPLVDVRSLIQERTEDGVPGREWLLDHVHPSIEGHKLIADALYRELEAIGLIETPADWQTQRDALWQRHLSSLNEAYYAHGAARLRRVQEWARGRIPEP
jgi:lysophospholipase L1-like esterase